MSHLDRGFCRVCGSNLISSWGERDGHLLLQCDRCELTFCLPYPTQAELTAMYNDPAWHTERQYDGSGIDGGLRRAMYELDIKDLEATIMPGGHFFDVGCAEGLFLEMLDDAWNKWGWDISDVAMEKAIRSPALHDVMFPPLHAIKHETLKVIHLRGTLEHLLEPMEFIHTACERLIQGGWLVVSNVPNVGSRVARMFRGRYRWILPGEHVNLFTIKTMQVMAAEAGLEVVRVTYPYFGTPYAHVLRDLLSIPINLMLRKTSPPWWGDIFTMYLRKV